MVLALEDPIPQGAPGSLQGGLRNFIADKLGRQDVRLLSCARLDGGAVQENWRIMAGFGEGAGLKTERYVLRTSAKTSLPDSRPKSQEFALLRTAWSAGVLVPEPLWLCETAEVIGADFFLSREVPGSAQGRSITALNHPEDGNPELIRLLGQQLAKIHNIKKLPSNLSFLEQADDSPALQAIRHWRQELNELPGSWPALEWGLLWCEKHLPAAPTEPCLVHGDFRTGNYMVETQDDPRGRLRAILDWEFAQWGDPMSDIGWFCAACWRFDRPDLEAGGIGTRAAFYQAYEDASGRRVDLSSVRFWEVIAHIRWAIIAWHQGRRFFDGGESSLDLGLTGRLRPAQLQKHLLQITAPERWERGRENMPDMKSLLAKGEAPKDRDKRQAALQLLTSAAELFRAQIEPALPADQRENGCMIRDALTYALKDLQLEREDDINQRYDQVLSDTRGSDTTAHLRLLESLSRELEA